MARIRVAIVQLTTHPYFTIGGRDFCSEPFLTDHEPILSSLSSSMDVASARDVCRKQYNQFQCWRVASSLEWLWKQWDFGEETKGDSEETQHLVVFPEGSLAPFQISELLVPFAVSANENGHSATILAGTHSFKTGQSDWLDYPNEVNEFLSNPFFEEERSSPEVVAQIVDSLELSQLRGKYRSWLKPFKEPRNKNETLTEFGLRIMATAANNPKYSSSLNHLLEDERATRRKLSSVDRKCLELDRIAAKAGYDAKSVLPIVHPDGSVTLRTKEAPSPFERTNISMLGKGDYERPSPFRLATDSKLSALPVVCSESLQSAYNPEDADIVAILGYHRRPSDFIARLDSAKMNGKLVMLANDGRFGGSGVFLINDNRAENWWFGEPRNGMLDKGDGILLVDVDLQHMAPEIARHNPRYPSGLKKLAAIIPNKFGSGAKHVHSQSRSILDQVRSPVSIGRSGNTKGVDFLSLLKLVQPLVDSPDATPLQRTKLWRLRELIQLRSLSPERAEVWCEDCELPNTETFRPKYADKKISKPRSLDLKELESKLAWEVLQHFEHETSIANEKGMSHNAGELVAAKRLLENRLGRVSVSAPLANLFNCINLRGDNAQATARQRLVRRVGRLVEAYQATSGWLFAVQENDVGGRATKDFFPVAAYNAPELEIYRSVGDPEMGIVGHVIECGEPYLANDVSEEPHSKIYREDVPSTRSEMAVPILANGAVVGVFNLEANYKHAFTRIDMMSLEAESTRLLSDMLILSSSTSKQASSAWHPSSDGWQLRTYLDRFCNAIATSLPTVHGSPSIGTSVWAFDSAKGLLSVIGTARFDFEYVSERALRLDQSHVGKAIIAYCKENGLGQLLPEEITKSNHSEDVASAFEEHNLIADRQAFKRKLKAERMELRSIAVFPFQVQMRSDESKPIVCALAVYGFQHAWGMRGISLEQMFNRTIGRSIARELGRLIGSFISDKKELATAYLKGRLAVDATAARSPLETVRQVMHRVMGAHGCTIFFRSLQQMLPDVPGCEGQLILGATTGVTAAGGLSPVVPNSYPLYSLDESDSGAQRRLQGSSDERSYFDGLTNYLGQNRDSIVRKNDVVDILECVSDVGTGRVVRLAPRNTLLEAFAPGASEHMRFLGASVNYEGENVGVVRLTRTGNAPPFSPIDEEVLAVLRMESAHVFAQEQEKASIDFNAFERTATIPSTDPNGYARLARLVSAKYGVAFHDSIARSSLHFLTFLELLNEPENRSLRSALTQATRRAAREPDLTGKKTMRDSLRQMNQAVSATVSELQEWEMNTDVRNHKKLLQQLLVYSADFVGPQMAMAAILEDLNESIFRGLKAHFPDSLPHFGDAASNPIVLSSLRCVVSHGKSEQFLHVLRVQPSWNSEHPDEDAGQALPRSLKMDANGRRVHEFRQPLYYELIAQGPPDPNRFHLMHALSNTVKAGICFPFSVALPKRASGGESVARREHLILSTDFAMRLGEPQLKQLIFPHLQLAIHKLSFLLERGQVENNMAAVASRYKRMDDTRFSLDVGRPAELDGGVQIEWWKCEGPT